MLPHRYIVTSTSPIPLSFLPVQSSILEWSFRNLRMPSAVKCRFFVLVFTINTLGLVYWMTNNLQYSWNTSSSSELITQFYNETKDNTTSKDNTTTIDVFAGPSNTSTWYSETEVPWKLNTSVNCQELLLGNETEIKQTLDLNSKISAEVYFNEGHLSKLTSNCSWVQEQFNNSSFYNSELERKFPVAFSFVIHENAHQVLRLVQLLYRPQNSFCFHYDAKSSNSFKAVFTNLAACLDNVIVPSKIEDVIWGTNSILEAQLNCIHDLQIQKQWRYIITLCGKELPLLTNREIVTQLMKQKSKSVVYSTKLEESSDIMKRLLFKAALNSRGRITLTNTPLGPIPFNLTAYKNMAYMALSEPFVHYLLHSDTAAALRQFLAYCSNPEEHFYSMLYMQDGVPGGHDYADTELVRISGTTWVPYEDIASELETGEQVLKHPLEHCRGKVIHRVCILNSADLHQLSDLVRTKWTIFYNKYFMEVDTTIMQCLEGFIWQRNRQEFLKDNRLSYTAKPHGKITHQ